MWCNVYKICDLPPISSSHVCIVFIDPRKEKVEQIIKHVSVYLSNETAAFIMSNIKVVVLYPNDDGATFDDSYYLSTHMPLVDKHWKQFGLQSWEITKFARGADGATPKFQIQATLTFESKEHFGKAMASEESKTVFGDIPNFTNTQPTLLGGNVIGSG